LGQLRTASSRRPGVALNVQDVQLPPRGSLGGPLSGENEMGRHARGAPTHLIISAV
jgi:hypothetical protein